MKVSKIELYIPKWFLRGIILVGDLFGTNGEFLLKRESEQSYLVKTNFLVYHRITSLLKVYLKTFQLDPKGMQKPLYPNQIKMLCKSDRGSLDFYKSLTYEGLGIENSHLSYWKDLYNIQVSPTNNAWRNISKNCFKTITDNNLI